MYEMQEAGGDKGRKGNRDEGWKKSVTGRVP